MLNNSEKLLKLIVLVTGEHLIELCQLPASIIFDHGTTSTVRKTKLLIPFGNFPPWNIREKTSDFNDVLL